MTEALSEKFLQFVAKDKRLGLLAAAKAIDECIKQTAAVLNVDYSEIYNTIFTEEHLQSCLLKVEACDKMTIDECVNSCSCFVLEPFGCLSRRIPRADEINDDPDKYIKTNLGSTDDLRKFVQIAAYLYYNYDGGGLTDNAYDAAEYHLKRRERIKGRAYEKIGAPPVEKIRTDLPYGMASLNKIKPGTMETTNFLAQFRPKEGGSTPSPGDSNVMCSWSSKLDGVSGMVVYTAGKLKKIFTRGDGLVGGDVTYLKKYLESIPEELSSRSVASTDLVVRGEFILPRAVWESKYKGSYSNARAFVSGKINAGFVAPALPDIIFVAYEIMVYDSELSVPQPSQAFKILDAEGFQVVDNGLMVTPTIFEVMEFYKKQRKVSAYAIDGLVLASDTIRPAVPPTSAGVANPTHTVAFKMILEEQLRDTKVISIDWRISRYGRYTPVAVYDAVYVDGVRMQRATAHNAAHIRDWSMGKGTKIKVARSGDVIPQIKDVTVDDSIPPIYPTTIDEGGYEWHWESSDIVLDEIETNREVLIKRVVHFFETIGVPRLREKTAEKMYDAGITTPEAIVKTDVTTFIKIKGIGKKTAEFFYDTIRAVMAVTSPDRFIVASTTFKSGVGRKLLKQLFRHIPNVLDLDEDTIREKLETLRASKKIAGFGPARIKSTSEGIPKFRSYLDSFAKADVAKAVAHYVDNASAIKSAGYNPLVKNKKFVLTGFMMRTDYELEDYIYNHHGDFVTTVTSDVEAIISGNVMEVSKKMIAAAQLNIPVLSISEFSERYGVPLKRFEVVGNDDED